MNRRPRSTTVAVVVVGAALLAAGCSSHAPAITSPKGSEADSLATVWWMMFSMGAAVYVIVAGFILWAVVRGRKGVGEGGPRDDMWIVWGGLAIPVVILAVLAVTTVRVTAEVRKPSRNEIHLEVMARRWYWNVTYVDQHFTTANEIHLPVGQPVDIGLASDNVVHSFWVPQLAGKVDTIPGQHNDLRFTPKEIGTFQGECAEFCGIQHAHMGFLVIVQSAQDYGRWLAQRQPAPLPPDSEAAAEGQQVFMREPCAGCHTIRGTQAQGTVGPDLTDVGNRKTLAGNAIANTPENMSVWISDSQHIKPGNLMPPIQLSATDLKNLVTYLEGLK